ncbi:hypothetical protein [Streptomyces sp. NPDC060194]|uniref:hypothetical protein n=1 Tax=Streptomyces sp. NPDC060194 TaxID=3347069 RepID=UPI00366924D9
MHDRTAGGGPALELLVHGVGGATPEEMLGDPRTTRVTGDATAAMHRRTDDVDAESRPEDYRGRPIPEAYCWSNLTSGNGSRALWLLLLPFMVVNLAHWMRPAARGHDRAIRLHGVLVRLVGLSLTVLFTAAACEVALDLTAWQCAGTPACAGNRSWLGFLTPDAAGGGGWWTAPGRRLALAALVPAALTGLLWYLSHRTWNAYESQQPLPGRPARAHLAADVPSGEVPYTVAALGRPGFWYGRRFVARLRAAHTAAGLLTVAAALSTAPARHDRAPGGAAAADLAGWMLQAAVGCAALWCVWVVCRRGRTESHIDHTLDRVLLRALPANALTLLACALLYAAWPRPGWVSGGRLPGDAAFAVLTLAQGLLVLALAAVALLLHRTAPDHRAALRGLAGPAVATLACALGGVMTGGVAQRVADWLDGPSTPGMGADPVIQPPVLLSWQASALPPLLLVLLLGAGWLARRTRELRREETARVLAEYPEARAEDVRARRIAGTRARAALTDRAPRILALTSAVTLLLGGIALAGSRLTAEVPGEAARGAPPVVEGAAQTVQALGSWLVGVGFLLFVTWGRRAYRDASARRTIGILWDVGTFWPRAAHPFAPPCYAERAVPDLAWRIDTWTRATGGRLVLSGHSQGSVLAAAAAWQLDAEVRKGVALLTYASPLERLYGRWFPAHFGPHVLRTLHDEVDCWRNLHRRTDPIGGPVQLPGVDAAPLRDPAAYARTARDPLPAPILGHSLYQADPAFAAERAALLARLAAAPGLPRQAAEAAGVTAARGGPPDTAA